MKKSKKTRAIAAAFALGTTISFSGCDIKDSQVQMVYGPPVVDFEESAVAEVESTNTSVNTADNSDDIVVRG